MLATVGQHCGRQLVLILSWLLLFNLSCWRSERVSHSKQLLKILVYLRDDIASPEPSWNDSESYASRQSSDDLNSLGLK